MATRPAALRTGSTAGAGDCGPPVIAGTRAGLPRMNPSPVSWVTAAYAVRTWWQAAAMTPGH